MRKTLLTFGIKKVFVYIILIIQSAIALLPLLWMGLLSTKTTDEIYSDPFGIPAKLNIENYTEAWNMVNIGMLFRNSIFVTVMSVTVSLFISAMASYALARFRFKYQFHIYILFLLGMMIPIQAVMLPVFMMNKALNLSNTYFTLCGSYVAFSLPTNILILVGFIKGVPFEIEEAAFIDGASLWKTIFYIILPVLKPAMATVTILDFLSNWNEFSLALVLINNNNMKTLTVGLASIAGEYSSNYGIMAAGLMFALVPVLIIYIFLQKYIVEGMTAGAVKG